MNNAKHQKCCSQTENYLISVDQRKKKALRNIGCSVECGYDYLTLFKGKTLNDLCKYLNLWLDEQKSKHVSVNPVVTEEEWKNVENLWKKLMQGKATDHQCIRVHEEKDISQYSKRIELMTYCINRDYFKSLFKSNTGSLEYKSRKCNGFSDYAREYYENLAAGFKCIVNNNDIEDYKYHISEECTLNNIPKTFPKCDEITHTIVDDDNYKIDINRCESTANVGVGHDRLDINITGLAHFPAELPYGQAPSVGGEAVSAGEETESEGSLSDPIQLGPLSQTVVSSTENGTSKTVYYTGLSTLGVVFTSTVLYKV
ncbi:hypothetical protein, conserved [Plasmodium vivax]|uniref:VIR protein n=1 Tax=Plasmodium vivax TaxID=5855 RepID=A0A1G4EA57_PLAVI|nr:hypothetical protein, conserved [Plasmodium vivax]